MHSDVYRHIQSMVSALNDTGFSLASAYAGDILAEMSGKGYR
jgi:hypothetical protein